MEEMKHQATLYKSIKSFFNLKMATRFLVSVSVFSFLIFHFSLVPFLLDIYELFSFSAYKTIDKNYMFLLCNGILVFILKNSVGLKNNSPRQPDEISKKRINRRISPMVEKRVVQERELASVAVVAEANQAQENELEDDDEIKKGSLSREELNKKCDDFIRKMKKEINSGA